MVWISAVPSLRRTRRFVALRPSFTALDEPVSATMLLALPGSAVMFTHALMVWAAFAAGQAGRSGRDVAGVPSKFIAEALSNPTEADGPVQGAPDDDNVPVFPVPDQSRVEGPAPSSSFQ